MAGTPAKPAPTCSIELVTPEMAKKWLGLNHRNRKLSDPVVRRLAGALSRNEWMISTDAIGLDSDDGVVNGQHRLTMIIEEDRAVEMLVVRNVDPNIIRVIDQGMSRSFSQLLQMDGRYSYPGVIAGATEWLFRVINDFERTIPTACKPSTTQLLDLFDVHPNIVNSVEPGLEVAKIGVKQPLAVANHYLFASVDPEAADDFFDRLASGLDVADGDPVYALREKVLANAARDPKSKEQPYVVGAWMVRAWEATRRSETVLTRQLKWVKSGNRAESYPKVTDVPWMTEAVAEAAAEVDAA